MSAEKPERLSAADCQQKASECRAMAKQAMVEPHRVMLLHIAETWERIASEIEKRSK